MTEPAIYSEHAHDDVWASLNHGGLLIAPARLPEHLGAPLPPLSPFQVTRLRHGVTRMLDDDDHLPAFLDTVLEDICGLTSSRWLKANRVDASFSRKLVTGDSLRPARLWQGDRGELLPVFTTNRAKDAPRLGIGRGRRAVTRVIEWLRAAERKVAVLSNGRQLRLIHAGADYDAFCEWDIALWFEEGVPGPQVTALRRLLGIQALTAPADGVHPPLVAAILDSRRGQGELSAVLGERVRVAVEELIQASHGVLDPLASSGAARPADIYIAATRMVMRMVVILFAEARELLPQDSALYHGSYGLQGLREELDRAAGGDGGRLRYRRAAWPRLLALFRLVYHGGDREELPVPAYGGGLFEPGRRDGDGVSAAVAALESPDNDIGDDAVHRILELLTRSRVKVRQGRRSTYIEAPVDFSDLSSEYIGILYEGLLDYELRRAPADDAVVFLAIGNEPALPFRRLEQMDLPELARLLDRLKELAKTKDKGEDDAGEDTEDEDAEDAEDQGTGDDPVVEAEDGAAVEVEPEPELAASDSVRAMRRAIQLWAERAVKAAKLVPYPRKDTDPEVRARFDRDVAVAARKLVRREVLPGEWFLVRWGGTRKGSGTFYTRPQLAGPTVRRTLQPLAWRPVEQRTDEHGVVQVLAWAPRTPEDILAIKLCDPAMGSGSFLVSALRYLTDALFDSLHAHGRLVRRGDGTIVRLADGLPDDDPANEPLPVPPDHDSFEDLLRARIKRHVVERCIYGVDIDPVAVELARLALWVETMDRRLPFEFLDHKLRCGNSLVGCWFDRFQDYPVMAWEREGGDKGHTRFVHHHRVKVGKNGQEQRTGDPWTQAIKDVKKDIVKELAELIESRVQPSLAFVGAGVTAEGVHDQARAVLETIHRMPVHESAEKARRYAAEVIEDPALRRLRRAFDAWCAVWFWPGDALDRAPAPRTLHELPDETAAMVDELARRHRFFHWELEFPDVFSAPGAGFDAIVGNPPWDIQKPSSMEFFSNLDPLYRTYTKQQALERQEELFESDAADERAWIEYTARFKDMRNWVNHAAYPFGDPAEDHDSTVSLVRGKKSDGLHELWRQVRAARHSYADIEHPFRHHGSGDVNTYKMFLELAHVLLRYDGGLGFLVPSGLYTDNGSRNLRQLFLGRCAWSHLYAFQNERFVFAGIDHRFKMVVVHVRKGGTSEVVNTRFRLGPGDSPAAHEIEDDIASSSGYLRVPVVQIQRFSPSGMSLLEVRTPRDLEILEKLYTNGVLLGDETPEGWGIMYGREFHMTDDSKLFPPRPQWAAKGYKPDEYGHWLKGTWWPGNGCKASGERDWSLVRSPDGTEVIAVEDIEDVALPLYQGIMVQQFDFAPKRWLRGTGLQAKWEVIPWGTKVIGSQFLMRASDCLAAGSDRTAKPSMRRVARNTDTRTLIACLVPGMPCGDKAVQVSPATSEDRAALTGILNSFVFDWVARTKQGGTQVDYHILAELPLLQHAHRHHSKLSLLTMCLNAAAVVFARDWLRLAEESGRKRPWRRLWAITDHERLRLRCILDAVVAKLYGLGIDDFAWILRDCDHPVDRVCDKPFSRTLDPKGFWRVDKDRAPELRHTVLSLVAFHELERVGLDAFLAMNDGDGWMLPETLRLSDYGLGHDHRATEHQPVAAVLGPRFLDWQLAQSVDESWDECARHAALIERIVPTPAPAAPDPAGQPATTAQINPVRSPPVTQMELFATPPRRK